MSGPRLPYDQRWAVDDLGTRYTVRFEGGVSRTATWRGIARLTPVPSRGVRRLDLVGDGTRLIQLPLRQSASRGRLATPPAAEPATIPPGERLLVLAAERILSGEDARGPVPGPEPGEIITVLTETGAIAADSPVPGQLAAVCQRLGAAGHGITVPPAAEIPAQWASVVTQRDAWPGSGPAVFAPLADVLPDVDVRLPPTQTDEGLRAALAARRQVPGLPILVLSAHVEQLYARELLADQAGGVGYLLKDRVFTDEQFTDALRTVAHGGTVMDPEVVAKLLARRSRQQPGTRLTDREREVLALMAEGRSNSAIAQRLSVSEKAVTKHSTNIFAKLGLPPSEDDNRRVLAVLAYLNA
jgi:DNA-binding NarL/FixJ family response regulator